MKILKTFTAFIVLGAVFWIANANANTIDMQYYQAGNNDINLVCNTSIASQCQGFLGGNTEVNDPIASLSDTVATEYLIANSDATTEMALLNNLLSEMNAGSVSTVFKTDDDLTSFSTDKLYFSIKQATEIFYFKNISGGTLNVELYPDANAFSHWSEYGPSASVVPVPAAVWLFGSALLGLVGFKRKQAQV